MASVYDRCAVWLQVFRQPWTLTGNGLMTYNGVLVGTVTQALTPGLVEASGGPAFIVWLLIALGGAVR